LKTNVNDSLPALYKFRINYEEVYIRYGQERYKDALQTLRQLDTTDLHKNGLYFRAYYDAFADVYINLKKYDSALYYNDIAVNHKNSLPSFFPIDDFTYYARIYYQKRDFEKALYYLNSIEDTSAANNSNYSLKDFHELSYKIHKSLGNSDLALRNFEKYQSINSKITEETRQKQAAIMKYKLEKDKAISDLKIAQAEAEEQQNQKFYYTTLFFIILLAVISFLFLMYKQKQKQRQLLLEKEKTLYEQKNQFLENISHEIRTPLTIIKGIIQNIKKTEGKFSKTVISQLEHQSSGLLNMVYQILDMHKLDEQDLKINLVQSDVIRFVELLVDSFQYVASEKQINLRLKTNLTTMVFNYDEEKLKFILSNLLSNAIKFTPESGKVIVEVSTSSNENFLLIRVEDNGIGIKQENQQQIFNRFYQTKSPESHNKTGVGIGLHFTKKLVTFMGGDIGLQSEIDKGTTVKVQLPVNQSKVVENNETTRVLQGTTEKAKGNRLISNSKKETILIIEDNLSVLSILSEQLSAYKIVTANDGLSGLEQAREIVPDLIVSDIMMPKKDGYELCKAVKLDVATSHIPVVLLTAKADQKSKIEGLIQKADAYIYKPYDVEELLLVVKNPLGLKFFS